MQINADGLFIAPSCLRPSQLILVLEVVIAHFLRVKLYF